MRAYVHMVNAANKGIAIYFFTFVLNCLFCFAFTIIRDLALVLELPRRNF